MINITTLNQLSGILEGQELLNAYNKAEDAEVSMEELDKDLSPSPVKRVTKKKGRSGTMIQKDSLAKLIEVQSYLKRGVEKHKANNAVDFDFIVDSVINNLAKYLKEKV